MDEDDIRMANSSGDESFLEMVPALAAALGGGVGLFRGFGTAGAKLAKLRKLKPKTEMEKELVAELEKALKYRQKSDKQIRDFRLQKKPQDERVDVDIFPERYSSFAQTYPVKPPLKVALDEDRSLRKLNNYLDKFGKTLDKNRVDKRYNADDAVFAEMDKIVREFAKRLSKYPKGSLVPKIDNALLRKQVLDESRGRLAEFPSWIGRPSNDVPVLEALERDIRRETDPSYIEYISDWH